MMITITGLTVRQKTIMDLLWSCENMAQIQALITALPEAQDRIDARALVEVAVQETLEAEGGLDEYAEAAAVAVFNARYS